MIPLLLECRFLTRTCQERGDLLIKRVIKMTRMIVCKECGEEEEHCAKGMCKKCYFRQYYEKNQEKMKDNAREYMRMRREKGEDYEFKNKRGKIICIVCEEEVDHFAKDMCQRCYYREYINNRNDRISQVTVGEVNECKVHARCDFKCFYCESEDDLGIDHIVSINQGGKHEMENLVTACKRCNSSKIDRDLLSWAKEDEQSGLRIWLF